jgi:hypothetical protein
MLVRAERLRGFLERHGLPRGGSLMGDLTKGGRDATSAERLRLGGRNSRGWPRGLTRCPTCGEPRGECLDPAPQFQGKRMRVDCRCAAQNRCAGCGHRLSSRKLNANYYDPADDTIWHVPGFAAFAHTCGAAAGTE